MQGTAFDFFVQWHLTERCNLRCAHCYQAAPKAEMSLEEVRRAMDNIAQAIQSWGKDYQMAVSPSFHFTGGEPLLREDLFSILDYARQKGFALALMSNGTLINEELARRLKEAGVDQVQVSLEGGEDTHDGLRGKGTFQKAVNGIKNLVSAGVATTINLTVSRLNVGQIGEVVRLGEGLRVGAVAVSRLVPSGRARGLRQQTLSQQELADLHVHLKQLQAQSRVHVGSLDPLSVVASLPGESPGADFPIGGCAAGFSGVTICADGTLMPCRRMDLPIGNIKESSFRQLWAESPVLWSLRQRQDYHGGCQTCQHWAVCRGCRAIALACARAYGKEDYLGPDPQCPYYLRAG